MKGHTWLKRIMFVVVIVMALFVVKGLNLYRSAFATNIYADRQDAVILLIKTGSEYEEVLNDIEKSGIARNLDKLKWVAEKKNYPNNVKPGRYEIRGRMSNNELINMLRSGNQTPLKITFNNVRTLEQFSKRIADQLEFSSAELLKELKKDEVMEKYGLDKHTISCMFVPNTYELYWNISVPAFLERMHREYNSFWNAKRTNKAKNLDMSRAEVITLASIVNEESRKNDEKERIAGVYINRLKKPMRLQADPTVIYAVGDFTINRVLRKHYKMNSPYNTYRIDGLPPGPICFPEISSIDAVLNYEKHKYLYFCAKPDFSGYHSFAKTLSGHNRNAALYRKELNKRRIYK